MRKVVLDPLDRFFVWAGLITLHHRRSRQSITFFTWEVTAGISIVYFTHAKN